MDIFALLNLFRAGGSLWSKLASICLIASGFAAASDKNTTGTDDIAAGVLATVGDGLSAYDRKDYNKVGNLIDAAIAGLTTLKENLVAGGYIKPRNQTGFAGQSMATAPKFPPNDKNPIEQ